MSLHFNSIMTRMAKQEADYSRWCSSVVFALYAFVPFDSAIMSAVYPHITVATAEVKSLPFAHVHLTLLYPVKPTSLMSAGWKTIIIV